MSPRLLQLTEKRAHASFWQAMGLLIIAVHAAYGAIALAKIGSMWGALLASVALFSLRMFWAAFKRADLHFAAIERHHLSQTGAWQRPFDTNRTAPGQKKPGNH